MQTLVIVNILGRGSFSAPLVQETTSGYIVRISKMSDGLATEWFPKHSTMTRSGILQTEETHSAAQP